ncbi:uncharacterized protein LOC132700528 isoform X2 [Cylas formicarius]|uniref:uncharacterized protein LOC132700528 isoform X2 n=1 Tax=Cylas formicarius TaxID=197179 RepID=UPI0029585740|nr:uncharacterized protein LOC132700528 isoform X2 [Cylas formicarius]
MLIYTIILHKMWDDARKLIKLLPKLEELYALDTRLSVREKDLKLYSKLKRLAISTEARQFTALPSMYSNNLFLLKKLCLKIIIKKRDFHEIYSFFNELIGLEELWIYDSDDSISQPIKYDYIVFNLKFLKKLVIKTKLNVPFLDYKPFGLAKVFETRRFKSITMCYVKCPSAQIIPLRDVSIFEPYETELEHAWDVLQKFHCELPCGVKNSETIYLTKKIRDIQFEELNFFHNKCFCNPIFIKATIDILKSENCENLKKLSLKSCVLQCRKDTKEQSIQSLTNRKYPFEDVVLNCKYLTELEIMCCQNCNITILWGFPLISKFTRLEKLTMEIPVHLDGKFLNDIFANCSELKSLKLVSMGSNENLNVNVYESLKNAKKIRDFCYENIHINLDKLFLALGQIPHGTLQRIFIKCECADIHSLSFLKDFLEYNDQLLFLFISIFQNTVVGNSRIQELLNKCKQGSHAKIYFAKKDESLYVGGWPIPEAHKDLLYFDTNVSVINFLDFR